MSPSPRKREIENQPKLKNFDLKSNLTCNIYIVYEQIKGSLSSEHHLE